MTDKVSAKNPALISREQAGNAIGKALRLFVGRGRRYSVKQLSNATGVSDRMIECAMAAGYDHRPLPDWALLSIMSFLGVDFTNEFLPLAHQEAIELGDCDHDGLAANCIDFAAEHARARHPESPGGVDIVQVEDKALRGKRAKLKAA